jgi:hypothetical protein
MNKDDKHTPASSCAGPALEQRAAAPLTEVKFSGVVLVCGECERRSNGPSKLGARQVRKTLKRDLLQVPVRLRVVQSSCLGLCPKKSMALAAVAAGRPLLAAEVRSDDEVEAFAAALKASFR